MTEKSRDLNIGVPSIAPDTSKILEVSAGVDDVEEAIANIWRPRMVERYAEKIVRANGAYTIGDVVAEAVGLPWVFENVVREVGGAGEIMAVKIEAETTAIASVFSLFTHSATPTCELDDANANTAPLLADVQKGIYKGRVDFTACDDVGTGMSETMATPSTYGKLPIPFVCKPRSRNLQCVLAIQNAVDLADNTYLRITLVIKQW